MSKIFGHASGSAGGTATTTAGQPTTAAPVSSGTTTATSAPSAVAAPPAPTVDVTAILDGLTAKNPEKLDWRHSIVDLMKLVGMDSSLTARKELAKDLHYSGDMNDSASMNVWLHKQVLIKLAENGGKVPQELLE